MNAFRRLQSGKACGVWQIPAEAFSGAAFEAVWVFYPVLLKIMTNGVAPSDLRMMFTVAIPKPGKPFSSVEAWRSISLMEPSMKAIPKTVRMKLMDHLGPKFLPGQGGAKSGSGVAAAQILIRGHVRRLHQEGKSGAIIFVDGISAFYATVREFVFDEGCNLNDAERIVGLIDLMHPSETTRARMMSLLFGPSVLQECGVPDVIRKFIMATLTSTGFTMRAESPMAYKSLCGTCPGAPLADTLFQAVFIRCLSEMQALLRRDQLCATTIDPLSLQQHEAFSPTWVDDVAIVAVVDRAVLLVDHVRLVVKHAQAAMAIIGVKTNFTRGKTEVMPIFRGAGSKAQRHLWLSCDKPHIKVQLEDGACVDVSLTDSYVHLGNVVHHSGTDLFDVKRRHILSQNIFRPLKTRLLRNPYLTLAEKKHLVHSMVDNKFLAGAGAWALRTDQEMRAFEHGYNGHWRQCCMPLLGVSSAGLTDFQVCVLLGVSTAVEVLRVTRVRFLLQALKNGSPFVLSELSRDRWWMPQVAGDVCQVCETRGVEGFHKVPGSPQDMREFLDGILLQCDAIRRAAQRYLKACVESRVSMRADVMACVDLQSRLRLERVAECRLKEWDGDRFVACPVCGQSFMSGGALGSHLAKVHKQAAETRSHARGSVCQVCMRDFHNTARLRKHLDQVECCQLALRHSDVGGDGPVIPGTERAWLGPRRIEGPKPFWALLHPVADTPHDVEIGTMNPEVIYNRLRGLLTTRDFQPSKAAQLVLIVFRLRMCFGDLEDISQMCEEAPLLDCTARILLDVIEACSRASKHESGNYHGCKWVFVWHKHKMRVAEHWTPILFDGMG